MIRRPPRSTLDRSSAASDVYKRQLLAPALRTPDDRFQGLHGWPYAPFYHQRPDGLRLHYVDTGARRPPRTWLCLHGQPTWSYLYRRMMPLFASCGDRVIAPDFLGLSLI